MSLLGTMRSRMKHHVKKYGRVLSPLFRQTGPRLLNYHSVGTAPDSLTVSPEQFAEHMEWLASAHDCISLDDAVRDGQGIAVTFDDGLRDQYENAVPVLRRLGIPATFFIVAGNPAGSTFGDIYGGDKEMTWDEIRDLDAQGFEIGSHTTDHRRLSVLSREQQESEISGSKQIIEEQLGHPIRFISFPYGTYLDYTAETLDIARDAGYVCAFSNRYGASSPGAERWEMKRIWLDASDDLPCFKAKINGDLDFLSVLDTRAITWIRRAKSGNLSLH